MSVEIYVKKTCKTCQKAEKKLSELGVSFHRYDMFKEPVLTEEKLREFIKKAGVRPSDILRKRDPMYKKLGLHEQLPSDDELIRLMIQYPGLIKRPIVVKEDHVSFGKLPDTFSAS